MKKNTTTIRIRYAETDQMGVVYHGNYAQFFEIGRTEWLRSTGITYKYMENNGVMLPVISLSTNFKKSALYDDEITVITTLKKTPAVKIEFDYKITNQNNELICTGNTILAFINMKTKKIFLALDLKDDPVLIAEYKKYHEKIWPEITKSIVDSGIENSEIYCVGNRLTMMLEVNDTFSFEKKEKMDANNVKVQEWETLMWKYQQALPTAKPGEKWLLMEKIFQL